MSNYDKYLGQYIDLSKEEDDESARIKIVRIIGEKGIDENGKVYPFSALNTFQKIDYIGYAPEVAAEIASIDPSLISPKRTAPSSAPAIPAATPESILGPAKPSSNPTVVSEPSEPLDEVGQFIKTAVNLSKKKGESSSIEIAITLNFPFDIEKVAIACSDICGEDSKILKELLKYSDISMDSIREAVLKSLMQPVENPVEHARREERFNETLNEELAK